MSNAADGIQEVWGKILPLNKIVEMGIGKGFVLPYTLATVSLAGSVHEHYEVFVADNMATVTASGGFNMICGTAPTAGQAPSPYSPKGDLLIFLFDASRVKCLRFRMLKKVAPLGLEWFDESTPSAWKVVP